MSGTTGSRRRQAVTNTRLISSPVADLAFALPQPAPRLGVFEESRSGVSNRVRRSLGLFGERIPRSARLRLDDQLLRALPVGRAKALPEEAITALAFDMNRAGAAPVGAIMLRLLCGTAGTVQAEDAQHLPVYRNEARIYYELLISVFQATDSKK